MVESAENYRSTAFLQGVRRQAVKIWAVTCAVVLVWILLILAAPTVASTGFETAAAPIYTFFGFVCHQLPDRSFHLFDHQFAVCSRCFGVYFGLFAGLILYRAFRPVDDIDPLPRIWLFLSMVPIAIDWSVTMFGIWENTFVSRFVTGAVLGVACAVYIVPALVEIGRNLTTRSHQRRTLRAEDK